MIKNRLTKQLNRNFKQIIDYYIDQYKLDRLDNIIDVSSPVFDYCTQGRIFVSVVIINSAKAIYFRHTLNKFAGWEIPGGFVNREDQSLEAAAVRIIKAESGLIVDELRPLLVAVNKFRAGNIEHEHYGIVFVALVRNRNVAYSSDEFIGNFMEDIPKHIIASDQPIIEYACRYINKIKLNPPLDEIDESSNLGWKYLFHSKIVRPFQRVFTSRKLKKFIKSEIVGDSVLDASCGDDSMIVDYANRNPKILCVANDICWYSIQKLINRVEKNNVIFTNHDVTSLPYKTRFDTVIFKNTLHHFNYSNGLALIEKLSKLANKKIIIVDVEDPAKTGIRHKMWNHYYRTFLNDQGENFWEFENFKKLVSDKLPESVFYKINTSRGNYMVAIYKNESGC